MLKPEAHGFNLIADLGLTEHLHHPYLDGNKHPRVIGEGRVQLSNRFFSRFTGVLTGQGEDREKWKGEAIIKPVQRKVVDGPVENGRKRSEANKLILLLKSKVLEVAQTIPSSSQK